MQEKLVLPLKIDRENLPYFLQPEFSTEKRIPFLLAASMLTPKLPELSMRPKLLLFLAIYNDPSWPSSPSLIN